MSIIIPALNESGNLSQLLPYLQDNSSEVTEIIVVDGGSEDNSVKIAKQCNVQILKTKRGRAVQMNKGATIAKGKRLYFLHADTKPPKNFEKLILEANSVSGCFRMKFDKNHWLLNFYSWFTRFNWKVCRGGDRSLFVNKTLFDKLNGFKEVPLLEDYELVNRLLQNSSFVVLKESVTTSSRMYEKYGFLRLQLIYAYIHLLWFFGTDEYKLMRKLNNFLS
ncbi:MAG: TIGR04283 family arsenosugar biosynthesis glycosyltransferase [Flavobacteriales bacterium]|nr:TIGR04283 family arsenosugar biosynthesis glycosyltransferase [Flavobacteriales bacterium]